MKSILEYAKSGRAIKIAFIIIASFWIFVLVSCVTRENAVSFMPDDSYYYFEIGKNILNGYFFSFDGVTLTNGFHPLWGFISSVIYAIFPRDFVPVAHLVVSLGLFLLGIFLLTLAMRRINLVASWAFLLTSSTSPLVLSIGGNGLETGLVLFCTCFSIWFAVKNGNIFISSLLFGLIAVSRLDWAVYGLMAFGAFHISRSEFTSPQVFLKNFVSLRFLLCVFLFVVPILPWLFYNYTYFANIVPESGRALELIHNALQYDYRGSVSVNWAERIPFFLGFFRWPLEFSGLHLGIGGSFAWLMVVLVFAMSTMLGVRCWASVKMGIAERREPTGLFLRFMYVFLMLFVISLALSSFFRAVLREWYIVPAWLAYVIAISFIISYLVKKIGNYKILFSAVVLVAAVLFLVTVSWWAKGGESIRGIQIKQQPIQDDAPKIARSFGLERRIGSSDCGALGFYSGAKVLNLDGLVNSAAFSGIKKGRLIDCITDYRIEYFSVRPEWYKSKSLMGYDALLQFSDCEVPGYKKTLFSNADIASVHLSNQYTSSDGSLYKILGEGWSASPSMKDGAWLVGSSGKIYLPLRNNENYKISISLRAPPPLKGFPIVAINSSIHGNLLRAVIDTTHSKRLYFDMVAPHSRITSLDIQVDTFVSLKNQGVSSDGRDLGVFIDGLEVVRMTPGNP